MLSLRSISLFAAIACATLSIAAPTESISNAPAVGGIASGVGDSLIGAGGYPRHHPKNKKPSPHPHGPAHPEPRGAAHKSIPDIFVSATASIQIVVASIRQDMSAKSLDKPTIAKHLGAITVVLDVVIADLKVVVVGGNYLTHNGVVLSVGAVAQLVWALLYLIIVLLWDLAKIVGVVDVTIGPILVSIGILLCEVLTLVLGLVVGLDVALAVLVKPAADKCTYLNYSKILVILGIHV